jgi:hypothetical protein
MTRRSARVEAGGSSSRSGGGAASAGSRIQHPHLVTLLYERVNDVGADEAGTAGHEDHAPTLA